MFHYNTYSRILSSESVSVKFIQLLEELKRLVRRENEDYILNISETNFIEYLVSELKLDVPEIQFEEAYMEMLEDIVRGDYFPLDFHVSRDKGYKKQIIRYTIPVSGNIELLSYSPTSSYSFGGGGGSFYINGGGISTDIINFYNDPEKIKKEIKQQVQGIKTNYTTLKKDIIDFNKSLYVESKREFDKRKNEILSKNDLIASLGIPLKKSQSVSKTFSIPQPRLKEKIKFKPNATLDKFKPEPVLDEEIYNAILKIVNDVGKNFERMPSVYSEKREDDLRDHIIMVLDPNFELGSVSGETFNKTGKTDIQLRYDSTVVFVAECKFWKGVKKHLDAISQLLSYMTWRDTKASLIVFVRQKDFSSVLKKVRESTSSHSNYLRFTHMTSENWYNYCFHINGDENREIRLAVQLYHLP